MRRRIVLALGATVLVGLLSSCTGANTGSGASAGVNANVPAPARADTPASGAGGSSANSSGSAGGQANSGVNQPPVSSGRQVIRTATIAVTANNVSTAAARAEQIATGA